MIVAIFVTFNQDEDFAENLSAVCKQAEHIIIVDNGSEKVCLDELEKLEKKNNKLSLIKNNKNLGIAKALNIGCSRARDLGFSRALLLDQDSLVTPGMVASLSRKMDLNSKAAVLGPQIVSKAVDLNGISHEGTYVLLSDSWIPRKSKISNEPLKVLFNITSGSLVCLNILEKLNGFNEELFIEGVDNEYGLRANRNGFEIYIDNDSYLMQQYGDMQLKNLFGFKFYPTNHSARRHYYVSRNRCYIWKEYYKDYMNYVVWDLISLVKIFINITLFEKNKLSKYKSFLIGCIDAYRGNYGKKW